MTSADFTAVHVERVPSERPFRRGGTIRAMAMGSLMLLSLLGCESDPIVPPSRGVRDFVWTRDTLNDGDRQMTNSGLWASSASDVYVVGHSSTPYQGQIWHYDGKEWKDISIEFAKAFAGSSIPRFTPRSVFGFGVNDLWIAGGSDAGGFVLHYDGAEWSGTLLLGSSGWDAIWGVASNDLWLGGGEGQLRHFDGQTWHSYSLPDSVFINHISGNSANDVHAIGAALPGGVLTFTYYRWDGSDWTREASHSPGDGSTGFYAAATIFRGQVYSTDVNSVTKRVSSGIWQVATTVPGGSLYSVSALGSADMCAGGKDASGNELVIHFNGSDWARLGKLALSNTYVTRAWMADGQVFMISQEQSAQGTFWPRTFVLRGK